MFSDENIFKQNVSFEVALGAIKSSPLKIIKLPEWDGYWFWDNKTNSIIIHCADGSQFDIRETTDVFYTLSNICRKDWCIYRLDKKK